MWNRKINAFFKKYSENFKMKIYKLTVLIPRDQGADEFLHEDISRLFEA